MKIQIFDKTIGLLEQALDLRSERHRVITGNIANQDTPGYKAAEIRFHEALDASLGAGGLSLETTHPGHVSSGGPSSPAAPPATPIPGASARLDGNTVAGEREMAKLAENTLMYDATIQMITSKFKTLKSAIHEGR